MRMWFRDDKGPMTEGLIGERRETDDGRPETGDGRPITDDRRPKTGDRIV